MSKEHIREVEKKIDIEFQKSKLLELGYSHAIWTLLSVVEFEYYKIISTHLLKENQLDTYVDGQINALTYPMQVIYKSKKQKRGQYRKEFVEENYIMANEWIDRAEDYTHFSSIFPLYYNGEIELEVINSNIKTTDWSTLDLSYEAYDRIINIRSSNEEVNVDHNKLVPIIEANMELTQEKFTLDFSQNMIKKLTDYLMPTYNSRFSLPQRWNFKYFSINEFKLVFNTVQAMAEGWFIARQIAVGKGMYNLGFNSALWTPKKNSLLKKLIRSTNIDKKKVSKILEYLTFGCVGVRNPDIAIQPLVDMDDGHYAVSPFLWNNVNCERNFCVLLNQIKEEKKIYSSLVNEKEETLRNEIISKLRDSNCEFEFEFGNIKNTDVDLAIIDRKAKKCLAIELKWFIEPAEVREVIQRSKEIKKGISQAKKINSKFLSDDKQLIKSILKIDTSFEFLAIVASVNSVGNLNAQDKIVPVIKIWHLVSELTSSNNLSETMDWLKNRKYLPIINKDYKILKVPIKSGEWRSEWYGIKPT